MQEMITKNFSVAELACRCCKKIGIDGHVVRRLQAVRDRYGKPMQVSSGFRCPAHNLKVGGLPNSSHLTGKAIDIEIISSSHRYNLLPFLQESFTRLGIGPNFIHIDIDETKPQGVIWLY